MDALAIIGDDVAAVLRDAGMRPVAAIRITGLPSSRSDRATFRVTLADGRTVKARRVSRAYTAARFTRFVRTLAHPRLSAVLAVVGRVVIEEWIEGAAVATDPPSGGQLTQAADILAALHTTILRGNPPDARPSVRSLHRRVRRQLGHLGAAHLLDAATVGTLVDIVDRFVPTHAVHGLTHNDFCATNMVEDRGGRVYVVDNEGLRPGFLAFDLARTWYRWPMSAPAWHCFVERYGRRRDPTDDLAQAPFWRIAAVVRSAHLRVVRGSPHVAEPLDRLRALATRG